MKESTHSSNNKQKSDLGDKSSNTQNTFCIILSIFPPKNKNIHPPETPGSRCQVFPRSTTVVFSRLLGDITTVEDLLRQGIVDLVAFCGTNLRRPMEKKWCKVKKCEENLKIFNSTINWLDIILHRDPFNLLENRYSSTSQAQCLFSKIQLSRNFDWPMHLELAGQVWMCHGGLQRHRLQGVRCAGRHAATNGLRCHSLRAKMLEEIREGLRRILYNTQIMSTRD